MSKNDSPSNQETQVPKETNQGTYFSTASPKAISRKDELRIMEHALNEVEVNKDEYCKTNNVLPSQRNYIKATTTVLDEVSNFNSDIRAYKSIIFQLRNEIGAT